MPKKELSYEEAIAKLEANIEKLEGDQLTLEQALAYFEEGIGLIRHCEARLRTAEGKLRELLDGEDGELVEKVIGPDLKSLLGGEPSDENHL